MAAAAIVGARILHLDAFEAWPLSMLSLMATTLLTSLCLAHLSYRHIELPGIKLGNWLLSRLLPRLNSDDRRFAPAIPSGTVADRGDPPIEETN